MLTHVLPVIYALVLWWLSTGVIFFLNQLTPRSFRWSLLGASAVLALALLAVGATAGDTTAGAAYVAFTGGVLAWGWQTLSYYMGFVTGPRTRACDPGCRGWRRFRQGLQVSLYHELAVVAGALVLLALTWGEPNRLALWTYLGLWLMHVSAKLNVFLGVRNLYEEFLPPHLGYLTSYFRRRPMNGLFPLSVTAGTLATVLLAQAALAAEATPFAAAGLTLLATLLGLAVLEHWFLVLPLPVTALWRWSLAPRAGATAGSAAEARPNA